MSNKLGKQHFLSYSELSERIGISASTLRSYYSTGRMPQPDATIGTTPGWLETSIRDWLTQRPGAGARTDLKKKAK